MYWIHHPPKTDPSVFPQSFIHHWHTDTQLTTTQSIMSCIGTHLFQQIYWPQSMFRTTSQSCIQHFLSKSFLWENIFFRKKFPPIYTFGNWKPPRYNPRTTVQRGTDPLILFFPVFFVLRKNHQFFTLFFFDWRLNPTFRPFSYWEKSSAFFWLGHWIEVRPFLYWKNSSAFFWLGS
jgi:hypothetical protein